MTKSKQKTDPDFHEIILRTTVEALAEGADGLAVVALEMISSADGEEAVFLRRVKPFFRVHQARRRFALTALATAFKADRSELKRYLLFKGVLNAGD